jgi:hypothetical protein
VQDLKEGEDPKEVEAGLPKVVVGNMEVDVGIMEVVVVAMVVVVVAVGFPNSSMVGLLSIKEGVGKNLHSHNSSMVAHLSIKAEAGEGLLSKEVADMVVAVADTVVVWVLAVAMT